jgi:hypothetical protein
MYTGTDRTRFDMNAKLAVATVDPAATPFTTDWTPPASAATINSALILSEADVVSKFNDRFGNDTMIPINHSV